MSFNLTHTVCHLRSHGPKQGVLFATDVFLETCQERVKFSCKNPDIAFGSNSARKHRQGLGKEIVPWNVACIQISSLSLSLTLSLYLSASSSFTFSRILLIQAYLCWSRLAYPTQESSQFLSPRFSISLPNSYQI